MTNQKFEHGDELDCEVTVYEGSHSTCEQTEGEPQQKHHGKTGDSSLQESIKDNYNI